MSRPSSRPSTDAPALRVLQLIGDTDDTGPHLDTLELHRSLDALGVQVRTLALGPGARGGLDQVVPVISPGRHSFAARTQLAVEARWADVLCLHGDAVLTHAALRRSGSAPPVVVALRSPTLQRPLRRFSAERLIARRAAVVVVDSADDAATAASRYGCATDRVQVIERSPRSGGSMAGAWVDTLDRVAGGGIR